MAEPLQLAGASFGGLPVLFNEGIDATILGNRVLSAFVMTFDRRNRRVRFERAESTLEAMGGRDAWGETRFLRWRFMGRRLHHWDRWTGDVRIEADSLLVLMNVRTKEGRAWDGGVEITDEAARAKALERGHALWVNDSYWLIMPYKLLDPGAVLRRRGDGELPDGRAARERLTED